MDDCRKGQTLQKRANVATAGTDPEALASGSAARRPFPRRRRIARNPHPGYPIPLQPPPRIVPPTSPEEPGVSPEANVSTASRPSSLKITDLRVARLRGAPFHSTLIRIDTDQGISGYGEVRDGGSPTYALMLKSRLLGQNPCDVDRLFRRVKQFGHHARQAGGVCAVEMALMDLAGRGWTSAWASCGGGRTASSRRRACWSRPPSCTPSPGSGSRRLLLRVLNGLATRNYEACAETVPQAFGLSRSSVPDSSSDPWPATRRPSGAVDAQRTALDELVAASPMGRHGAARHRTSPAPRQRLPPPADASASATSRVRHQSARDDGMTG